MAAQRRGNGFVVLVSAAVVVVLIALAGVVVWLTATIPADPDTGRVGTPTVAVDGEKIPNAEIPAALAKILG